jgi:hypothetical protein
MWGPEIAGLQQDVDESQHLDTVTKATDSAWQHNTSSEANLRIHDIDLLTIIRSLEVPPWTWHWTLTGSKCELEQSIVWINVAIDASSVAAIKATRTEVMLKRWYRDSGMEERPMGRITVAYIANLPVSKTQMKGSTRNSKNSKETRTENCYPERNAVIIARTNVNVIPAGTWIAGCSARFRKAIVKGSRQNNNYYLWKHLSQDQLEWITGTGTQNSPKTTPAKDVEANNATKVWLVASNIT